ncbi:hypothetical protein [Achromobacter xylosoxidans]|uniref:hypothetical protein n=1 Tax=Alcaligenes xylosoxydans xylosoxydans TaxID=85698 RepID=UPI002A7527D1|nr:hypothetical protein [Achromobacter xylosoxidans]WPQ33678.1 hypothetical protein SLH34_24075 [Achromobacter xylosoxidans]
MTRAASNTTPVDMGMAQWIVDVLQQRDARIYALLNAIGDIIPPETHEHVLYRLAFEMAEDETNWTQLREALGLPAYAATGGAA